MTINSQRAPVRAQGNGATVSFAFAYPYFAAADLQVLLFDQVANDLVAPAPVLNGAAQYDYTLDGVADPETGMFPSTNVVFNNAPLGTYLVVIVSAVPRTQNVDIANGGRFPADVVNTEFDRLTVMLQDIAAKLGLTLSVPVTDAAPAALPVAADRANMLLGFDDAGAPVMVPNLPSGGGGGGGGGLTQIFSTTVQLLAAFGAGVALTDKTTVLTAARAVLGDGGGGVFYYDAGDAVTADNGGTVRVDAQNRRWKLA